ncbi:hypothetical protein H5T57_06115 [Candidatus Bipolaricaulota bacterium]|nr:hypothetical protein [Candidatus Bipolaricaulota bacterium]
MRTVWAVVLGVAALGVLSVGQGCAPCVTTAEPPCYTAFWQGEDVCFELVVPFGLFCCCCTGPQIQVTGWRVATLDGNVVYQEVFPAPVAPGKWVWKQVDANGNPVEPGFYKIIISTTTGEYENTVKIVARPDCCQPCCFFPFFFFGCWGPSSKSCAISWCTPYVKLYRCPACAAPCVASCGITIYLGLSEP